MKYVLHIADRPKLVGCYIPVYSATSVSSGKHFYCVPNLTLLAVVNVVSQT